jgi:hypothetical protein
MKDTLFKIPLVQWVRRTIEKMQSMGASGVGAWNAAWLETYLELGGKSKETGRKGCPRSAAYGLWCLGLVAGGGKPRQDYPIPRVDRELGKNAAYAAIAIDLLQAAAIPEDHDLLWSRVRRRYIELTGELPATTDQGAVKVASILFRSGQLALRPNDGPA